MADEKTSQKRLPAIRINWAEPLDVNIYYPLTPAMKSNSIQQQAKEAGKQNCPWNADAIKMVEAQHGLYTDIPMMCKGRCKEFDEDEICDNAAYCPFDAEKVDSEFRGANCPVEVLEAFKLFVGYVVDLEITPADFTDLRTVIDLIRLELMIRRCDLYQKDKPIWQNKVAAVHQNTGKVHYDKAPAVSFEMMTKLRADLDKKYNQLVATRLDKIKADSTSGQKAKDMATYVQNILDAAQKTQRDGATKKKLKARSEPVIDAEYTEEEDNG